MLRKSIKERNYLLLAVATLMFCMMFFAKPVFAEDSGETIVTRENIGDYMTDGKLDVSKLWSAPNRSIYLTSYGYFINDKGQFGDFITDDLVLTGSIEGNNGNSIVIANENDRTIYLDDVNIVMTEESSAPFIKKNSTTKFDVNIVLQGDTYIKANKGTDGALITHKDINISGSGNLTLIENNTSNAAIFEGDNVTIDNLEGNITLESKIYFFKVTKKIDISDDGRFSIIKQNVAGGGPAVFTAPTTINSTGDFYAKVGSLCDKRITVSANKVEIDAGEATTNLFYDSATLSSKDDMVINVKHSLYLSGNGGIFEFKSGNNITISQIETNRQPGIFYIVNQIDLEAEGNINIDLIDMLVSSCKNFNVNAGGDVTMSSTSSGGIVATYASNIKAGGEVTLSASNGFAIQVVTSSSATNIIDAKGDVNVTGKGNYMLLSGPLNIKTPENVVLHSENMVHDGDSIDIEAGKNVDILGKNSGSIIGGVIDIRSGQNVTVNNEAGPVVFNINTSNTSEKMYVNIEASGDVNIESGSGQYLSGPIFSYYELIDIVADNITIDAGDFIVGDINKTAISVMYLHSKHNIAIKGNTNNYLIGLPLKIKTEIGSVTAQNNIGSICKYDCEIDSKDKIDLEGSTSNPTSFTLLSTRGPLTLKSEESYVKIVDKGGAPFNLNYPADISAKGDIMIEGNKAHLLEGSQYSFKSDDGDIYLTNKGGIICTASLNLENKKGIYIEGNFNSKPIAYNGIDLTANEVVIKSIGNRSDETPIYYANTVSHVTACKFKMECADAVMLDCSYDKPVKKDLVTTMTHNRGILGSTIMGIDPDNYKIMTFSMPTNEMLENGVDYDVDLVVNEGKIAGFRLKNPEKYSPEKDTYYFMYNRGSMTTKVIDFEDSSTSASSKVSAFGQTAKALNEEMITDDELYSTIENLEEEYIEEKSISVNKIAVSDEAKEAGIDDENITATGLAFNAGLEGEVGLKIGIPETEADFDETKESVQLEISLLVDGVEKHGDVTYPIVITMNVPEGLSADDDFEVIHVKSDTGELENLCYKVNDDGTISFVVKGFSTFIFANKKEEVSDDGGETGKEPEKEPEVKPEIPEIKWIDTVSKVSETEYIINLATREKYNLPDLAKVKADGKDYKITYSTNKDSKYASMSKKGLISAKKEGKSVITVKKSNVVYTITVNVFNPQFTYTNPKAKYFVTNTGKAITPDYNSMKLKPVFTLDKNALKRGLASINAETGEVTPLKKGTVTVTAIVGEGNFARKVTTKVKIYDPSIYASKTEVKVNKSITLKVKNGVSNPATEWSIVSGQEYATISPKGKLKGIAKGTVVVKAVNNGREMTQEINVVEATVK